METTIPACASMLGLPAELRNEIYHLVLATWEPQFFDFNTKFKRNNFLPVTSLWTEVPPIIQTCRQVRSEALPIYYGTCNLNILIHPLSDFVDDALFNKVTEPVRNWLNRLDCEARKALLDGAPSNTKIIYGDWTRYGSKLNWLREHRGYDLREIYRRGEVEVKGGALEGTGVTEPILQIREGLVATKMQ